MLWAIAAVALVAIAVAAVSVAGGGEDLPDDAVARVGETVITKEDFNRLASRTAVRAMGTSGGRRVYDPPGFEECVEAKKANRPTETALDLPPDKELRRRCENEFRQARDAVMGQLIEAEWLRQEARRVGIPVTRGSADRQIKRYLAKATPVEKAEFELGLRQLGSRRALLDDLQLDLLEARLVRRVYRRVPAVTDADVRQHYGRERERFVAAERRDLRMVLALDRARAARARTALERGASWSAVAARYSVDDESAARGGRMDDVKRGQLDPDLEAAAFDARPGRLGGPIESQFGWYVFEVTDVTGATRRSLEEARAQIRRILRDRRRQQALGAFTRELAQRYQPRTICADEYATGDCANG